MQRRHGNYGMQTEGTRANMHSVHRSKSTLMPLMSVRKHLQRLCTCFTQLRSGSKTIKNRHQVWHLDNKIGRHRYCVHHFFLSISVYEPEVSKMVFCLSCHGLLATVSHRHRRSRTMPSQRPCCEDLHVFNQNVKNRVYPLD